MVGLRNDGKQLHEINLVELAPGKTVDDVVVWIAGDLALVLSKWSMEGSGPDASYSVRRGPPPT